MSDKPNEPHAIKPAKESKKAVTLNVGWEATPNFKCHMVFNAYDLEAVPNGVLLRVGYIYQNHGMASEVLSLLINNEGLQQLRDSSKKYIQEFTNLSPKKPTPLPHGKLYAPVMSNMLRVSRSGKTGELSFFTVTLNDIANVTRGNLPANTVVTALPVALLHSDLLIHEQLVMDLVSISP